MAEAFSLAVEIFGVPALVALLASLVLTWLARRMTPAGHDGYFILPAAVANAYFAGYSFLPRSWAAFIPQESQAWPWLPYLGLAAATFAASLPPSSRSPAWKLAIVAVAPMAAAALAPAWPVFGFGQRTLQWFVVAYLLLIGVPLQHVPARHMNRTLLGLLTVAGTVVAVVTGAMVSTRMAQLAAIAAAALAGCSIATFFWTKPVESSLLSLILVYTVLVGGIAVVACVEPDPPQWVLLPIPLLPLAVYGFPPYRALPFARGQIG